MIWFGGPEYLAWAILVGAAELAAGLVIRARHWWRNRPDSRSTIHRLQAEAWIETAAVPTTSEPSSAAPSPPSPGRGRRDTRGAPLAGVPAESPRPTSTPAGGPQQSVTVGPPDSAVADSPLPALAQSGWETTGAVGPRPAAPARSTA